jgi:hypothetical protein
MSLTIALQNTTDTDQSITLFDSGGVGTASFIETNSSFTGQSQTQSLGLSASPSTQVASYIGTMYYNAVFNPSTGYYFGSVGTNIGITATINGSFFSYLTAIPSIANRTFDDIQNFLTNTLRNNGTNPRPNAQVILSTSESNGITFLSALILDTIEPNESVVYNSLRLYNNTTAIGVGGAFYNDSIYYNQIYTSEAGQPNPNLYPIGIPQTTFADNDGWFIIQGNNLTSPSSCIFRILDGYLSLASLNSSHAYQFEFQLTEVLPSGNFQLSNYPSTSLITTINGSSTAIQTFSGLVPSGSSLILVNTTPTTAWNGQIRMRIRPMTGSQAPNSYVDISFLSQLNSGGAYLSSNPNIVGRVSSNGIGLREILNSTTGNTYKVTSLYIWSVNPVQLTQSLTYGLKNANGNIVQTELDVVIDPFAQNSVTYRTNGMNGFEIDSNSFLQFILKANSAVNMKFEFEKIGSDEIKLIEMGLGGLLAQEFEEKSSIDEQLANDFDTFYLKQ